VKNGPPLYALLNLGFGNVVPKGRVVAIVSPASAPMKRLKDQARDAGKLVDATQGRRTRSIVVTDSDHVILSAIQAETVSARFASDTPDLSGDETSEREESADGPQAD
jgi:regulator of extracellular matrix RemA (YlzA/DUF370 family)